MSARLPHSSAGVHPWVSLPPWRGRVSGGTNKRELFRPACFVELERCPVPRIRGEPGERFGVRLWGADRAGQLKNRCGILCHENTTSLSSVFGPGSRQHVRRLKSNGAESRGRKGSSAEALPYRQTAGGSWRGKTGERVAFGPNGSGHAVVQPGTILNHSKNKKQCSFFFEWD